LRGRIVTSYKKQIPFIAQTWNYLFRLNISGLS
jgi:hypothetical protein